MDKEYNGYRNYATWNVALWINNDEYASTLLAKYASVRKFRASKWGPQSAKRTAKIIFNSAFGDCVTPDDISLNSRKICWREIAEVFNEYIY